MAVTYNARGTSVSSFQIGKGGPTLTATAGVLELRDGQTFRILDSGNTDSVSFSHDGTNFNIVATNTDNIYVDDVASFYVRGDGTATGAGVQSRGGAQSTFSIGNQTTTYDANSDGYLRIFGEAGSTIYGGQISVIDSRMRISGTGANEVANIWLEKDTTITDGNTFRIEDSTSTDYVDFSHDGTDFNIAGTNTAAINVDTDFDITSTGYLKLPSGTEAQRPGTPAEGMLRLNTDDDQIEFYVNGAWQSASSASASLQGSWRFSSTTTEADPGARNFRMDNATIGSVTELYLSDSTNNNFDASTILSFLSVGDVIYIQQENDATKAALFKVSGALTDNTGWWTVPVEVLDSNTIYTNNAVCGFVLRLGDPATSGNVSNTGTPVDNQVAVWTDATTIEGDANFTWDGSTLVVDANNSIFGDQAAVSPTSGGVGQIRIDAPGYKGYIAMDNTAMYIGNNSDGRPIVFQTSTASTPTDRLQIDSGGIDVTGDVSGTTIGGITEANLLDKTSSETISGAYTFSTGIVITDSSQALALRAGDTSATFVGDQITFGYGASNDYQHAIGTRHNSGSDADNAIDFYLWDEGVDTINVVGTFRALSLDQTGTELFTDLAVTGDITVTGTVDGIDIATDVAANTLKVTNATHTGQVTGATALSLDVTAITDQPASGAIAAADTILINDGGVLSEATFTQMDTYFNSSLSFGSGDGTVTSSGTPLNNEVAVFTSGTDIDSDSTFTWDGTGLGISDLLETGDTFVARFGSNSETWLSANVNSQLKLYNNGLAVLLTQTAANGGITVDNDKTGAGMERVLTVGDLENGTTRRMRMSFLAIYTAGAPNVQSFKVNNSTPASVTEITLDDATASDQSALRVINNISAGDLISVGQENANGNWAIWKVDSAPVDQTGYWTIAVTVVASGTNFANGQYCTFEITHFSQISAASLTTAGIVELATGAETNTGTDATRAVTPDGLDDWTGSAQVTTLGTIATGTWQGTTIDETQGGTGQTTYATGDMLYASASNVLSKLAAGTNTHVLTLTGGVPTWAAAPGAGSVDTSGTPVDNQVAVFTDADTIEGTTGLTYNGTALDITGNITLTGTVDGIDIATDVAANTAKVTNATHTGQVTGATALALDVTAVTAQPASGALVGTDTLIVNDGGTLSEATMTQVATFANAGNVNAITAGDLIDISGTTNITVNVDLSEATDMTAAMVGTDEFIVLDAGVQHRKAANEINLSIFNDDIGHTTPSLADLTDTDITTPADASLLIYDTTSGDWRDAAMSGDATITDTGVITVSNAATADAWTTTRTIGMSGDVTSDAVNIDGSGNITITNTVVGNDSHTHDANNLTGTTLAAGVVTSSLTTVGTIGTGVWEGTAINQTYLVGQSGTNTGDEPAASLTVAGIVELATVAETNTGTDATRAVTPDGLDGWTGSAQVTTVGTIGTGTWQGTTIGETYGGTGTSTYATGDILYADAANSLTKLTAGSNDHLLTLAAGVPSWSAIGFNSFDTDVGAAFDFMDGTFLDSPDVGVSSNGTTITLSLEKSGGGDLRLLFSTGVQTYDTTPAATVSLTAGTDTNPTLNYVYVLESTGALAASTTDWPTAEYAPVATVLCQTAASLQTDGAYKLHAWTDHTTDGETGHLNHINFWIRNQPATWRTGVALSPTVGVNTFDVATTIGTILQLHEQSYPVFNTSTGDEVMVVNDNTTAFKRVGDLVGELTDSTGTSMSGRNFSLVFWGVVSEDDANCQLMVNLPAGSYTGTSDAEEDVSGYSDYSIPDEFLGVGFLIARVTIDHNSGTDTWTLLQNDDLRGLSPGSEAGAGGSGLTETGADLVYLRLDGGNDPVAAPITFAAATTAGPSINLPHGTAPTTPTNGDIWTTTSGLYARVNGSTVGPMSDTVGTVTSVSGTGTVSGLTLTGTVTSSGSLTLGGAITGFDNYVSWTVRADSGTDQAISSAEVLDIAGGTNISTVNAAGTLTINNDYTYTLPAATTTVRGGIELEDDTVQTTAANTVTTTASRTYGLQVNAAAQGVINVPWTDTVYTLPEATATVRGGIELFSNTDQSVAANAVSSTASRTYGIQLNSSGQAVVNVPWTDNDSGGTVTSVGTNTGLSGTVTTSGNLSLDLPSLAVGGTLVAGDWLIADNGGVQNKQLISAIPLSIFNNDSGWTSNTGTVTSVDVNGGTGITVTEAGPITSSGTFTVNVDYLGTDNIIDAATNLEGTAIATGDTIMYHDATDNNVKKGFVSDLPFSNNAGTVTGTGSNDRVAVWSGTSSLDSSSTFTWNGTTLTATNFSGNGSSLTSLTAANISAGDLASGVDPYMALATSSANWRILLGDATDGPANSAIYRANGFTFDPSTDTLSVAGDGTSANWYEAYTWGDHALAGYGTGDGTIGGSITDNQIAVGATTADDIEGSATFTWDGTNLNVGNASAQTQIKQSADTESLAVYGGSSAASASIALYGGTHATLAGDMFIDADLHTFRLADATSFMTLNSTTLSAAGVDADFDAITGTTFNGVALTTAGSSSNFLNEAGSYAAVSASTITVADESADTSCYPVFVTAATGTLAPKTGTNITFNSSTGELGATAFEGALAVASTPTYSFSGDTDSGLYSNGADSIGLVAGGSVYFRVASDRGPQRLPLTKTSGDLNTVSDGTYRWTGTAPTNAPFNYAVVEQIDDGAQAIQLAFGSSTKGRLAVRRADSGTFYAWTEFAPLASPTFTGTPAAPTASAGTNTTQIATTAFVLAEPASTVTVADESADTTCFPLFVTAATGDLAPKTGSNLTFNSSTGLLAASSIGVTNIVTNALVKFDGSVLNDASLTDTGSLITANADLDIASGEALSTHWFRLENEEQGTYGGSATPTTGTMYFDNNVSNADLNGSPLATDAVRGGIVAYNSDDGWGLVLDTNNIDEINLSNFTNDLTTITVADESADTTCFPLFVTAATGSLQPKTGTNITFNSATGHFTATSKSFLIEHPTKPGKKLQYGSLEGPENGVYVRGRLRGCNVIELPDYWTALVDPDSITVNLTAMGGSQDLFVQSIENNTVTIGGSTLAIDCFYTVYAERVDVDKLEIEID